MIFNSESNSYSELLISNSVKSIGRNRGIVRHVGGARMIHQTNYVVEQWSFHSRSCRTFTIRKLTAVTTSKDILPGRERTADQRLRLNSGCTNTGAIPDCSRVC